MSGVVERRRFPIALIPNRHVRLLTKFKDEICQDPQADHTPEIELLAAELRKMETEREQNLIFTMLINLYDVDARALKRDLAKLSVLGGKKADAKQRVILLGYLYEPLSRYLQEDFSEINEMCDKLSGDAFERIGGRAVLRKR